MGLREGMHRVAEPIGRFFGYVSQHPFGTAALITSLYATSRAVSYVAGGLADFHPSDTHFASDFVEKVFHLPAHSPDYNTIMVNVPESQPPHNNGDIHFAQYNHDTPPPATELTYPQQGEPSLGRAADGDITPPLQTNTPPEHNSHNSPESGWYLWIKPSGDPNICHGFSAHIDMKQPPLTNEFANGTIIVPLTVEEVGLMPQGLLGLQAGPNMETNKYAIEILKGRVSGINGCDL